MVGCCPRRDGHGVRWWQADSGRSEIVVTTNILGDVVRNVVGDAAEVRVLMKPNADPHSFGVSAQEAEAMNTADLIVYNGLGLEENVTRNVESAAESGVPTLAVGSASIRSGTPKGIRGCARSALLD